MKVQAARYSPTSVNIYQNVRRHIAEDKKPTSTFVKTSSLTQVSISFWRKLKEEALDRNEWRTQLEEAMDLS
jgi:hypothetical protein